ncbi:MAG: cation transporter [Anaerolineaceae bacterium]|nr:cation transporter [Anaerolineaceae bacterium]
MQLTREKNNKTNNLALFRKAIWITLIGNIILAVGKAIAAYSSGSVALYADAANSISDVLYSILFAIGLWMASQPPDLSHPQGHSRFEPLLGILIALTMSFAAYSAARESFERLLVGGTAIEAGWPTLVLIISAVAKIGMYYAMRKISKQTFSPAIEAAAKDNLSDVMASSAAFLGAFASTSIHPLTDPLAGFLVAIWILRNVIEIGRENIHYLTGGGASPEILSQIISNAEAVEGVLQVHQNVVEYVGPHLMVDLHINVDGNLSLYKAHEISDEVTQSIENIPEIDRVYVHLEPHDWQET